MVTKGYGWILYFIMFNLVSSVSRVLDTFKDVKLHGCTCTLSMVMNDVGLVDVKNSACNNKCSKKSIGATLGGTASVSNVYKIQMKVNRGTITIVKLTATLVVPAEATSQETGAPEASHVLSHKSGPFCDRYVAECLDGSSFPNIGQGFRGYNLILGDPLNFGGDPGYTGHIFDEAGERNGMVRFGNTAGNDLNRCDGSVRADFIETADEFHESILRSESSSKTFQIGYELEVSASVGVDVAVAEASLELGRTIPPLYQSVSSNSQVMAEISEGLESNRISITRSAFSCYEYEFKITKSQHPVFTSQFLSSVSSLESCLLGGLHSQDVQQKNNPIINGTTAAQDECAMVFLENYGTHYIKAARFGSKMSILTVLDSKTAYTANREEVTKCASKSKQWSLLGLIGGGSDKENCMEDLFASTSGSTEGVLEDIVVTTGSRPKADYGEWAEQKGTPEIVQKTIAPISELFTSYFMTNISFKENGDATIKELLETYLAYYCGLFRSQCNYVVAKPYCPHLFCNGSTLGEKKCFNNLDLT